MPCTPLWGHYIQCSTAPGHPLDRDLCCGHNIPTPIVGTKPIIALQTMMSIFSIPVVLPGKKVDVDRGRSALERLGNEELFLVSRSFDLDGRLTEGNPMGVGVVFSSQTKEPAISLCGKISGNIVYFFWEIEIDICGSPYKWMRKKTKTLIVLSSAVKSCPERENLPKTPTARVKNSRTNRFVHQPHAPAAVPWARPWCRPWTRADGGPRAPSARWSPGCSAVFPWRREITTKWKIQNGVRHKWSKFVCGRGKKCQMSYCWVWCKSKRIGVGSPILAGKFWLGQIANSSRSFQHP